jgi:hypothetical protein
LKTLDTQRYVWAFIRQNRWIQRQFRVSIGRLRSRYMDGDTTHHIIQDVDAPVGEHELCAPQIIFSFHTPFLMLSTNKSAKLHNSGHTVELTLLDDQSTDLHGSIWT